MFHDQFFGWNQKSKTQQKVGLGPAQSTYLRALSPEPWALVRVNGMFSCWEKMRWQVKSRWVEVL